MRGDGAVEASTSEGAVENDASPPCALTANMIVIITKATTHAVNSLSLHRENSIVTLDLAVRLVRWMDWLRIGLIRETS